VFAEAVWALPFDSAPKINIAAIAAKRLTRGDIERAATVVDRQITSKKIFGPSWLTHIHRLHEEVPAIFVCQENTPGEILCPALGV